MDSPRVREAHLNARLTRDRKAFLEVVFERVLVKLRFGCLAVFSRWTPPCWFDLGASTPTHDEYSKDG